MDPILSVSDLRVSFDTYGGTVKAVRGISFDLHSGECLAVVGESGCGKTVTAQSIMRLVPVPPGHVTGNILFEGKEILSLSERKMRKIRGRDMGMIFQDPMTSLNPTMTIGRQVEEVLREHEPMSSRAARKRVLETLDLVGIPEAEKRYRNYPHEFSGGMRQRLLIAMAIICRPKVLIADEPTTALDVTIQAQILEIMHRLQKEMNTGVILVTHDLGVVANMATRIAVVYAGKVVERGLSEDIFSQSGHPYTQALLRSVPRIDQDSSETLAAIEGSPPDLFSPPQGCGFAPRCEKAMEICKIKEPPRFDLSGQGHSAACWLHHPQCREGKAGERRETPCAATL